jgi:hypothetical protein
MPLYTKPFRFARGNRRLTQTQIDERERAMEWERRHAGCEDSPCPECGGPADQGDDFDRACDEARDRELSGVAVDLIDVLRGGR